jgi:hypothetical protein
MYSLFLFEAGVKDFFFTLFSEEWPLDDFGVLFSEERPLDDFGV